GLHSVPTDRVWLRDSAPCGVLDENGRVVLLNWVVNGWAKYPNWKQDAQVGDAIARITGLPRLEPTRASRERIVLECGSVGVNGVGALLVTATLLRACLLV